MVPAMGVEGGGGGVGGVGGGEGNFRGKNTQLFAGSYNNTIHQLDAWAAALPYSRVEIKDFVGRKFSIWIFAKIET